MKMVSIITICKDDKSGLKKTIKSVDAQNYCDYEHILVLAGECGEYTSGSKRFVVQDSGKGISAAFNEGLKYAKGKYCVFLNSGDEFIDDSALKSMMQFCDEEIDIVSGFAVNEAYKNTIPRSIPKLNKKIGRLYLSHQASVFRISLFENFGSFDEQYKIRMDLEWLSRLSDETRIVFIDKVLINFESGGISGNNPLKSTFEEIHVLKKILPYSLGRIMLLLCLLLWFRISRYIIRRSFLRL